jgi:hypothetical protein
MGAGSAIAPIEGELCDILRTSLQALATAGQVDAACHLAARACAVLRQEKPERWGEFNRLLHRLSPMTGDVATRGGAERARDG